VPKEVAVMSEVVCRVANELLDVSTGVQELWAQGQTRAARAISYFAARGISRIERLMTDNPSAYRYAARGRPCSTLSECVADPPPPDPALWRFALATARGGAGRQVPQRDLTGTLASCALWTRFCGRRWSQFCVT
jgi:hypothetical protein